MTVMGGDRTMHKRVNRVKILKRAFWNESTSEQIRVLVRFQDRGLSDPTVLVCCWPAGTQFPTQSVCGTGGFTDIEQNLEASKFCSFIGRKCSIATELPHRGCHRVKLRLQVRVEKRRSSAVDSRILAKVLIGLFFFPLENAFCVFEIMHGKSRTAMHDC